MADKGKRVRRPRVDFDGRNLVMTHGFQHPIRVVLHDTESHDAAGIRDLEGICNFWRDQDRGYGAHVIVDSDANSAFAAEGHRICWHVANRNTGAIGIEIIGFARFLPSMWFLRLRQLHKVARWLAYFNYRYEIPLEFNPERGVTTHAEQSRIFGGDHYDPGRFFPTKTVLRLARNYRKKGWR